MILSKKLDELLPDEYRQKILDFDSKADTSGLLSVEIAKYFNDADLKQAVSEITLDYLSFPKRFRWPVLSNDTSFALVYLESFDKPQSLKQQNLETLIKLYNYSLMRINKILLELESLEENYNQKG